MDFLPHFSFSILHFSFDLNPFPDWEFFSNKKYKKSKIRQMQYVFEISESITLRYKS